MSVLLYPVRPRGSFRSCHVVTDVGDRVIISELCSSHGGAHSSDRVIAVFLCKNLGIIMGMCSGNHVTIQKFL